MKQIWEASFREQVARRGYNTAPVEALVRQAAYHLRDRRPDGDATGLHFLEVGCGAGPNLRWLAERGATVSGLDIASNALTLCRQGFAAAGLSHRLGVLVEGSADALPFPDASFDGVLEACVFQHLPARARRAAFAEVARVLRPGGLFGGYMLGRDCSVFRRHQGRQLPEDPGTVVLEESASRMHLTGIGLSHFFTPDEIRGLLPGFAVVDPCRVDYTLPAFEAARRGYDEYLQAMWAVYAVK